MSDDEAELFVVIGKSGRDIPEDEVLFVILPGECGEQMAEPEKIKEVVWPYLTHPGRHYGLE
jgi:2-keto-4-pentenoate hydratase/2-oxohepta-3-ene-1,7-dioic acid hydratase in catechol pathway